MSEPRARLRWSRGTGRPPTVGAHRAASARPLDAESSEWLRTLRARTGRGRCDRPPARTAPPRGTVRGRPPPVDAPASARQRARRHRHRGRRRRAHERPPAPRRLPRRQPLHDLGLQVRAARGGGQAAETRLAGTRDPARGRGWALFSSAGSRPDAEAEQNELLTRCSSAIAEVLTPHQRHVLVALAVNGVPIDVLAERLNTNRGALYKTLHDARRKLRDAPDGARSRARRTGWRRR